MLKEDPETSAAPKIPETRYFLTREEFDTAVGSDFIEHANHISGQDQKFMVALSHGQSPSGAYRYILEHFNEINNPENILFTFVNSPLVRQRNLQGTKDAWHFIISLYRNGFIGHGQLIGPIFKRSNLDEYVAGYNKLVSELLKEQNKEGFDYVFLACDPAGAVAAIERNSTAFQSTDISVLVNNAGEKEITLTPHFLLQSKRIAFLATKTDKRRPLALLYASDAEPNESPGFLRYLHYEKKRLTVFIDDQALTWPQIEVHRKTQHGATLIHVDTAWPYHPNDANDLPVVLLVHGFLGLNSYDELLASLPSDQCIAAAMHYGTIPQTLPASQYSQHITRNIEAVVEYFGQRGHPVYIFDHSVGNIYFIMIDHNLNEYPGIKKYLCGRIGANPFFGHETKHALLGFLDNVIIPSLSNIEGLVAKTVIITMRGVIPLDSKSGVRKRAIEFSEWLMRNNSAYIERLWKAAERRILYLMSNLDSVPLLNRVPIEHALNRLPAKLFVMQIYSALQQSISFDKQHGLRHIPQRGIPVLVLKSNRDGVARFIPHIYEGQNIEVTDITNPRSRDPFREHLFHMVNPQRTIEIILDFIKKVESQRKSL